MVTNIKRLKKRPLLLLEIVIALALISLCILPLLAPRAEMVKEQNAFIGKMELDHDVNLLYADVLERLQKNEIVFNDILAHTTFSIDQTMLNRQGIPKLPLALTGTYRFDEAPKPNHKSNEASGWSTHRLLLTFIFVPAEATDNEKNKYLFQYRLFLAHKGIPTATDSADDEETPQEKAEENEEDEDDDED